MRQDERRQALQALLQKAIKPIPSRALADRFSVTRQVIVRDIASLRERGYEIVSTNQGYLWPSESMCKRVFSVRHTGDQTEDELLLIVRAGGIVDDVFVWHKVYGRMQAKLSIATEDDVETFMAGVRSGASVELMHVTGGYHYHTVRASSEQILNEIEEKLRKRNYITK